MRPAIIYIYLLLPIFQNGRTSGLVSLDGINKITKSLLMSFGKKPIFIHILNGLYLHFITSIYIYLKRKCLLEFTKINLKWPSKYATASQSSNINIYLFRFANEKYQQFSLSNKH